MAIVQTGSVLTFLAQTGNNTGTVSTAITVPSDADFIVVGWSGFGGVSNYYSTGSMTFTKGGVDTAMTSASTLGDSSSGFWCSAIFYMALPDTGTNKTLKWDWLGSGAAGSTSSLCSITFWKGVNTSSPVRGSSGANSGSLPYTSGTITAQSGDLIVAFAAGSINGVEGTINSWSNLTLLNQITGGAVNADAAWATGSPFGNTTVAASTGTNYTDGGIVAISLIPAPDVISNPLMPQIWM